MGPAYHLRSWIIAAAISVFATCVQTLQTSNTVLILARDAASAQTAANGLLGYGIPYQSVIVPQAGISLPTLKAAADVGNFGSIVISGEVAYQYTDGTGFRSALTTAQFQELYDYQTLFGVRMVRLDAYPSADFGVTIAAGVAGCCNTGVEQFVSLTTTADFPTANLKTGASITTSGLWHYPATITNATIAKEFAQFGPAGAFTTQTTAGVINTFGKRQQMVFFTSWATDWATASTFLEHAWIHWATRGLYTGYRRIYFSTQVDDMFLDTELYQPKGASFRLRPADIAAHVTWQTNLNTRLPAGSLFFLEIGHNGNGDIESAVTYDRTKTTCFPDDGIEYPDQVDTALEFVKPLGSGTNLWPQTPATYNWSAPCALLDPLMQWFSQPANLDNFAHISHTFSHEALNNATYSDASKEISFNRAWARQNGISNARRWSNSGLIPPAITGMHNGDAIKAWLDNGILNVVGDNTRPVLRNQQNSWWPLISTIAANGQAGLLIMPRWATTIYYNCDLPDCTLQEWKATSAGTGDFQTLLKDARNTNARYLLSLHQEPFMFHQANLRVSDVPSTVVNGQVQQLSLLQIWIETVLDEVMRLTTWPIRTLKHDELAQAFRDRMTRDQCKPNLTNNYSSDGSSIISVTVTATGNTCTASVPITFPGGVTNNNGGVSEKFGSDSLTVWVKLAGAPVTFTLQAPVVL